MTIREGQDRREVDGNDDASEVVGVAGKEYIKLECPHCKVKCVTFNVSENIQCNSTRVIHHHTTQVFLFPDVLRVSVSLHCLICATT